MSATHSTDQSDTSVFEAQVMQRYARGEISLNQVAELLHIHVMDAQALLDKYQIDLQLSVEDFQREVKTLQDLGLL